jgi:hypothetical protein
MSKFAIIKQKHKFKAITIFWFFNSSVNDNIFKQMQRNGKYKRYNRKAAKDMCYNRLCYIISFRVIHKCSKICQKKLFIIKIKISDFKHKGYPLWSFSVLECSGLKLATVLRTR